MDRKSVLCSREKKPSAILDTQFIVRVRQVPALLRACLVRSVKDF